VGLLVDVGVLYSAKARLQASVDGASLAAARALNLGQTTDAQASSAKQNAVNWFYANFPNGNWGTTNTQMSQSTVNVFDDPNNPRVRNVTVTASTNVPTYFMGWFGLASTAISATGNASRRDVVVMMVLDRSGSMSNAGACGTLIQAAKIFTGQFANGRDRIGLVSFSDNVYDIAPTTDFQTKLGYTNDLGSGTGEIDNITCKGGTSTAQAISVAYNELYKTNLPGALNVIMFETDGLPNTLTMNFWDSANNVAGIANGSGCLDANNKTKGAGGFATAAASTGRHWTTGQSLGTGSYYSDIPAGLVGAVASTDPGQSPSKYYLMLNYWATTESNSFNSTDYIYAASGCAFNSTSANQFTTKTNNNVSPPPSDLAWFPATDVYGNQLNPPYTYLTVTTDASGHIKANSYTTYHNAVLNATDYAAYQARTNATLPVYFFGIGLGGTTTSPPDYVMMQRLANDPNGDNYNTPALYQPCAQETNCVTYPDQPQGTFIFSSSPSSLSQAFLSISSQVLRLSK